MKRRTFLKSFIGVCLSPNLLKDGRSVIFKKTIKNVPEAIYTAKTVIYDARMVLGEWLSEIIERDMIEALSGI